MPGGSLWQLEQEKIVLASWYFPPGLQTKGLEKLGEWRMKVSDALLLIGGDFNLTLSEEMERVMRPGARRGVDVRLETFLKGLGMVGLWQMTHPVERQYSYTSNSMGSLSRLDYLVVPQTQLVRYSDT